MFQSHPPESATNWLLASRTIDQLLAPTQSDLKALRIREAIRGFLGQTAKRDRLQIFRQVGAMVG
jgi:hypothetical protein